MAARGGDGLGVRLLAGAGEGVELVAFGDRIGRVFEVVDPLADGAATKRDTRIVAEALVRIFREDATNTAPPSLTELRTLRHDLYTFLQAEGERARQADRFPTLNRLAKSKAEGGEGRDFNEMLRELKILDKLLVDKEAELFLCCLGLRWWRKISQAIAIIGLLGGAGYTGARIALVMTDPAAADSSALGMEVLPGVTAAISSALFYRQTIGTVQLQENNARARGTASPFTGRLGCATIGIAILQYLSLGLLAAASALYYFGGESTHTLTFSALAAAGLTASLTMAPFMATLCCFLGNYQKPIDHPAPPPGFSSMEELLERIEAPDDESVAIAAASVPALNSTADVIAAAVAAHEADRAAGRGGSITEADVAAVVDEVMAQQAAVTPRPQVPFGAAHEAVRGDAAVVDVGGPAAAPAPAPA